MRHAPYFYPSQTSLVRFRRTRRDRGLEWLGRDPNREPGIEVQAQPAPSATALPRVCICRVKFIPPFHSRAYYLVVALLKDMPVQNRSSSLSNFLAEIAPLYLNVPFHSFCLHRFSLLVLIFFVEKKR